jgi:hypothetical protein
MIGEAIGAINWLSLEGLSSKRDTLGENFPLEKRIEKCRLQIHRTAFDRFV